MDALIGIAGPAAQDDSIMIDPRNVRPGAGVAAADDPLAGMVEDDAAQAAEEAGASQESVDEVEELKAMSATKGARARAPAGRRAARAAASPPSAAPTAPARMQPPPCACSHQLPPLLQPVEMESSIKTTRCVTMAIKTIPTPPCKASK